MAGNIARSYHQSVNLSCLQDVHGNTPSGYPSGIIYRHSHEALPFIAKRYGYGMVNTLRPMIVILLMHIYITWPQWVDDKITVIDLHWRHWTTNMLVRYMLPSVCLRLRQFSQLSFIQYMGLCVFSLPNSPVMIVRMCTLSYHHHQTGSMNH